MVVNTVMTRKTQKLDSENIAMSWYTVNVLGMKWSIKNLIKSTLNNTEENFKFGIPKNDRKNTHNR